MRATVIPGLARGALAAAALLVVLTGCASAAPASEGGQLDLGGDGAPPAGESTMPGDEDAGDADAGGAPGPVAVINPATMPEPGTFVIRTADTEIVYAESDGGLSDFECSLAGDRVELNYQQQAGHHALKLEFSDATRIGGDEVTWLGQFTARSADLDEGASYSGGGTIPASSLAIDPPYLVLLVPATFVESRSDADPEDLGVIQILATCS